MSIGRKLYTGFGSILGILVLLFVVSFTASHIEHTARNTASDALQSIQTIEKIRFQVMQGGLDLRNYLLSATRAWKRRRLTIPRRWNPPCGTHAKGQTAINCAISILPSNRINKAGMMN